MKIPTSRGYQAMRTIVRGNLVTYTLTRPSGPSSKEAMGEELVSENTTTVSTDMWVFAPRENPVDTQFGERMEGSLQALALPGADVEPRDKLTYNGVEYEVLAVTPVPDDETTALQLIDFDKTVN